MSDKNHDFGSLVCIYAQLLPKIRQAAKPLGYAIAIHGTMARDFDLVAVPWVDDAVKPIKLVEMIAEAVGGFVIGDTTMRSGKIAKRPTRQPHGRLSWNICWGGKVFIDLSVMPLTAAHPDRAGDEVLCECEHPLSKHHPWGFFEGNRVCEDCPCTEYKPAEVKV